MAQSRLATALLGLGSPLTLSWFWPLVLIDPRSSDGRRVLFPKDGHQG